ncbi:MAG: hypothetical protein HKN43_04855 [Rhodothermales bacterium]|nr:hypothetical protein [Rhodothermales bacterium]
MRLLLVLTIVIFATSCTTAPEADQQPELLPTLVPDISFRNLGPGNRQLELINSIVLDPAAGEEARIVQTTAQEKEAIAIVFQPASGDTTYIRMPDADGARAIAVIDEDVFIGTYLKGQVFHWRQGMETPRAFQLPRPNGERLEFVFSVDKASDGFYYIGTWPEGDLMRLDLESGTVTNLGPMTDDPPREYYLRHINTEFEGRLFLSFGTEVSFKEYNLETGETREFLPASMRDRSWVSHSTRFRNMIVALVDSPSTLVFIDADTGEFVREVESPGGRIWPHNFKSLLVHHEHIYFGTIEDDQLYRYSFDEDTFEIVGQLGHPIGLAEDDLLFARTRLGFYTIYDLSTDNIVLQRQSDFLGDGMLVHSIAEGPDASVVGGTYINQGLFQYRTADETMYAPGRAVEFPGQIDNLVTFNDKVYLGHYTKGRFSVWDPQEDWSPGSDQDSNPKTLGTVGNVQDRVPHGVVGPDNRIYFATKPEYGKLGGSLVVLDPETEEFTVHRNVVKDQSVYALVPDRSRYIYASTSVRGGLGARPAAAESKLFVWDTQSDQKVMERSIVEGAYEIWGLDWLAPDTLVGAADSVMFIYDVKGDAVIKTKICAPEEIKKVVTSRDGWIYAMTEERLLRVSTDLESVQTIDVHEGYWDSMVETSDGRLFVGRGPDLLELVRRD